jgi:hypothetical protein
MIIPVYTENYEREREGRFEGEDDHLGLTVGLHLVIDGEDGKIMYSAHGSTTSRINGNAEWAILGDKTMYILVTEVE